MSDFLNLKNRIYRFIEPDDEKTMYDYAMIVIICISLIPLCFKESTKALSIIDCITTWIFIVDYLARWATADYKLRKGAVSFFVYPFTFLAIVDLLSILPFFLPLASGIRAIKIIRLVRSFRVFRAFKVLRYSRSMIIIINVIKKQAPALLAVCTLAIGYIFISALLLFNIEPDTFGSFFDAIYWATVSLTTVGYGDIFPVTNMGRFIAMLSSFVGIAIVALPAGIITAGYMDEVSKVKE